MLTIEFDASQLERAAEMMRRFPEKLIEALRLANVQSAGHVITRIKQHKLVGNPLHRRTGNLIRSWSVIKPTREANGWKGGIGSNCDYARYHELGFDGDVSVRAHERKPARTRLASAWGDRGKDVFTRRKAHQREASIHVNAHSYHKTYAGKPYARPAFAESAERIRATHHDNIRQAWEKSK